MVVLRDVVIIQSVGILKEYKLRLRVYRNYYEKKDIYRIDIQLLIYYTKEWGITWVERVVEKREN